MPLFSIINIHYQPTIPHPVFMRGINSIQNQTFKDFELLVYHDGPLTDTTVQLPVPVRCMAKRYNDWGHSLRDRGIHEATGDYIVIFNADNVLYPHALAEIAREIARPPRLQDQTGKILDPNDIIIFPVAMIGLQRVNGRVMQFKGSPPFYTILTGNPPVVQNIDCMQLVMKRSLWLAEGGWSDKRELSDGFQYQRFAAKYGYREVGPVCGEHH
jgi:glycosyltransferase involved in cell wall biosynthesis